MVYDSYKRFLYRSIWLYSNKLPNMVLTLIDYNKVTMPKDPFKFCTNETSRNQLNTATLYVTECIAKKQSMTEILINSKKFLGYYLDISFMHRLYRQNRINPLTHNLYKNSDDMNLIKVTQKEVKTFSKWNEYLTYKALKNPGTVWESIYRNNIDKNIEHRTKILLDILSENL